MKFFLTSLMVFNEAAARNNRIWQFIMSARKSSADRGHAPSMAGVGTLSPLLTTIRAEDLIEK
jgi:hypothetical protein